MKLKYTTASAVKEKEGKLKVEPEILCEGKKKKQIHIMWLPYSMHFVQWCNRNLSFPSGFELPRINYDINGKKHQFVYGNCVAESALAKKVTSAALYVIILFLSLSKDVFHPGL